MKNMIKEKKTLLILRVVFGVLLLAGIVCSILVYRHFDAKSSIKVGTGSITPLPTRRSVTWRLN